MNRNAQPFLPGTHTGVPPTYEMLKEEHEVAVLGGPQSPAPMATTVINIQTETSVPDHIVWSLFNTIFMNWCCLGFVAFAYSVKVGVCAGGVLPESAGEPGEVRLPRGHVGGDGESMCGSSEAAGGARGWPRVAFVPSSQGHPSD